MEHGLSNEKIWVGRVVFFELKRWTINKIFGSMAQLLGEDNTTLDVTIRELEQYGQFGSKTTGSFDNAKLQEAMRRYEIIKPILDSPQREIAINEAVSKYSVSRASIFRWIGRFKNGRAITSLVPHERTGGRGKSRMDDDQESLMGRVIRDKYMTKQSSTITKTFIEVRLACRDAGIESPSYQTVRRRIESISDYEKTKARDGRKSARKKYDPKTSNNPDNLFPLSSVQIDHTLMDIMVVDEKYRQPIGRPWITLAIDTFSRMVVGYYIGFEKPNTMSVGLCISQGILAKEEFLAGYDIYTSWPVRGIMQAIHLDGAKEFDSKMLDIACAEYEIEIHRRPTQRTEYGAHIERLMGNISTELHDLSGTTFNRYMNRQEYDSEKEAVFTLRELENWILTYFVEVYHNRLHKGIGTSPIAKWNEGIQGSEETLGIGMPDYLFDQTRVTLDFMPFEERTIQDYGVLWDGITYYSDILRKWINAIDSESGKLRAKKKFIFRRDPRDISIIYFLDPDTYEYYEVGYADQSRPVMTIWELREVKKHLKSINESKIDENAIFEGYIKLKEIEENAKNLRKKRRTSEIKKKQAQTQVILSPKKEMTREAPQVEEEDIFVDFEPFEDIDDGSDRFFE